MSGVSAVVLAVLNHMKRDRSTVLFLVLLPLALMVVMGNVYAAEGDAVPTVAVLVVDPDPSTDAMVRMLDEDGAVEVRRVDDRPSLDDSVRRRRVDAGLVLEAGSNPELVGAPDVALPGGLPLVIRGAQSRVDQALALAARSETLDLDAALAALPESTAVPVSGIGESQADAAIGVLVLMAFMNLIAYSSLVPSHRLLGVVDRMGAAPVGRRAVLLGYAVAFVAVAVVQVSTMLLAGRFVVGIDWGPPAQVALIAVGLAVAAGGVGTLASTLLPTPESGSTIGGPVGFALGMLGGCLWPLDFVGGTLETVGRFMPHSWAVDSLRSIAEGSAAAASIAITAAALVGVGLALAAVGSRRFRATWA
jgi:ABC-2 type transport system permease protein